MNEIEAVGAEAIAAGPRNPAPGGDPDLKPAKAGRPWIFGLLIAPSAVLANGVIQGGVLAYMLSQQGIGSIQRAHMIWVLALPTMIYFLWSPLTDFLVRRRTWLLIGGVGSGVLMGAALRQPDLTSPTAFWLIFLSACASQLVVSSCGGMMGALRSERVRRTSGSFYQAGSLAFGALATLVLIPISDTGRRGVLGLAAAAMIALPALAALLAPHQDERNASGSLRQGIAENPEGFAETRRRMGREFVETFWRWEAIPYTLCMVFPIASGAAVSLITGVARDYGVNGAHVAWMNGFGGAVLMGAGALPATAIPARRRAPVVYLTLALVNAATLGITWLGPLRPLTYYLGVTLYLFTIGACYAYFTAVLLEFLGQSGRSGGGRYSIINSLGNVPVLYMIELDGWGGQRWGPRGLSATECVLGMVASAILLVYFLARGPKATVAVL